VYYLFPNILKYKSYVKNSVDLCYFTQFFAIENFRGECSSVEMLKDYMASERLGTPGVAERFKLLGPLSDFVLPK